MLCNRLFTQALLSAVLAVAPLPLAAQTTSASDNQNEPLTVLLDWFVNPDHGPLILAQQKGYFRDQNLKVELIAPADPSAPPRLVAAGKGDIAISYQPQLHLFADQGLPLMRFGTLVATPLNSLVVLQSSGIDSISKLRGRKVGFSVGGFEDAILGAMLRKHGLDLKDVELINVNFSLTPALLSKSVDAVIGAFRNFELNQLDIEGAPGRAFYVEEEGVPPYEELIFLAHNDRRDDLRLYRFLRAIEAATLYIVNYPQESWKSFVAFDPQLDTPLNRRAWRDTLPRFALRPQALDVDRYIQFAHFLSKNRIIRKPPPPGCYLHSFRNPKAPQANTDPADEARREERKKQRNQAMERLCPQILS